MQKLQRKRNSKDSGEETEHLVNTVDRERNSW